MIALILFNSCSDDDLLTAQPSANSIDFQNTFEDLYILEGMAADSVVENFTWNEVDFNVVSPITYDLQAATNADFDSLQTLTSSPGTSANVNFEQIREVLNSENLEFSNPDNPREVSLYFRVRAYLGNGTGNVLEQFSDATTMALELPEIEESLINLFLVGDATGAGWNTNNNNTPLFRDAENDDVYYFQGRFAGGDDIEGFKLIESLGDNTWQPQWGLSEGALTSSTILGNDVNSFPANNDSYYSLVLNIADLTYTWEEINETSTQVQSNIGIIGDATPSGWDADTDMTQSEFNPHIWYIQDVELTDGEAKFRANDAWDLNWGGATPLSGQTTIEGANIPVEAGSYDVWFNTLDGRYIFIPQE